MGGAPTAGPPEAESNLGYEIASSSLGSHPRNDSNVASMLAFIDRELNGRAPEISASEIEQLQKALASAVHFYELAEKRNEIFTQNIIRAMERSGKDISVVVVGGFHEKGLKEALEAAGVSTVVISPKINDSASDIPYVDRMVGKPTHLEAITSRLISAIDLGQKISGITPSDVRKQAAVGLFLLSAIYEIKNNGPRAAQDLILSVDRAGQRAVPGVRMSIKPPVWDGISFHLPIEVDGKDASLLVKENGSGALDVNLVPISVPTEPLAPRGGFVKAVKSIMQRGIPRILSEPISLAGFVATSIAATRSEARARENGQKTQELFSLIDDLMVAVAEKGKSGRVSSSLERLEAKAPNLAHWPSWNDAEWEGLGNLRYVFYLNRLYAKIQDPQKDVLIRLSQMILDHFTSQKSRGRLSTKTREDRLERFYLFINEQVEKLADTIRSERELVIQYPAAGDGSTLIGLIENLSRTFPNLPIRIEASDISVRYYLVEEREDFAIFKSGGEVVQIGLEGKLFTEEDNLEDVKYRSRFESMQQKFWSERRQEFSRLNPKFEALLKKPPENMKIHFEERDVESNPYDPETADIVLLSNFHYYVTASEKQVEYRFETDAYGGMGAVLWTARLDGIRQLFEFIGRALRPEGVFLVLQNSLDGETWAQDLYRRRDDRLVLDDLYSLSEEHGNNIFDGGSILNIARLKQMGYRQLETIPIELPSRERTPEEKTLVARLSRLAPVAYDNLKIIFSDHSHTLFTPGKEPDRRLAELLEDLFENGALLIIETGDASGTVVDRGIIQAIHPKYRQQIIINSATGAVAFEFNSNGTLNREKPVFNLAKDVLSSDQFQSWKEIMQNTFARYELGEPEFTVGYGDYSTSSLANKDDAQLSLGLAFGLTMMDEEKARKMNQWLRDRGLPPMVKTGVAWDLRTSIAVHLKNEFQKAGLGNLIAVNPVSFRTIDTTIKGITKMQGVHELIRRGVIRKKLTEIRDRLEKKMTPEEQRTFRKNMPEDFDARYAEVWGDSFARIGNRRNDFELAEGLPDVYGVSFGDRNVSDLDLPSNVVRFRGPEGPIGVRFYLEEKKKVRAEVRAQDVSELEEVKRHVEAMQELQRTEDDLVKGRGWKKALEAPYQPLEKLGERFDTFPRSLFETSKVLTQEEFNQILGERILNLRIQALKFLKDLALSLRKAADLSERKSLTDDTRKKLATTTYPNVYLRLEKAALRGEVELLHLIAQNEQSTYPSADNLVLAGLAREELDRGRIRGSARGEWVREYQKLAESQDERVISPIGKLLASNERVISSIHKLLDDYEERLQYETLPREYLTRLASKGDFKNVSAWLLELVKRLDKGYEIYTNITSSILNDPEFDSSRVEAIVADAADFVNLVLLFEREEKISFNMENPDVSQLLREVAKLIIDLFVEHYGNNRVFKEEARHVFGGRDYALFSDVHSSAYGINALLQSVPHAKPIIVGDLVDRGHELFEILKTTKRVTLADHDLWALGAAFGDPWLVAMWLRSNYRDDNEEILRQLGIDLTPIEQLADAYEERHENFNIKKFLKVQRRKIEKEGDLKQLQQRGDSIFLEIEGEEHRVQKIDGRYFFEYQGETYPFLHRTFNNIEELAAGNLWLKIWLADELKKGKQGNWQEPAMILARAPENLLLLRQRAYTLEQKRLTRKLRLAPSLTFDQLLRKEQRLLKNLVEQEWQLLKKERQALVALQLEFVNSQKMRNLADYLLRYGKVYEVIGPSPLLKEIDRQLADQNIDHIPHPRALLLHAVPVVNDQGTPVNLEENEISLGQLPDLLDSYQEQLDLLEIEWRRLVSKHVVKESDLSSYFGTLSVQDHLSFFRLLADGNYSPLYARAQKRGYHMYVDGREEPDNFAYKLFEHHYESDEDKKEAKINKAQQDALSQAYDLSSGDFQETQDGNMYLKKSANAKIIAKFAEAFGVDAIVGGHVSVKTGRIKVSGDPNGARFFRIDPYFVEKGGAAAEMPTGLASAVLFGGSGVHEIYLKSLPELLGKIEERGDVKGKEGDKQKESGKSRSEVRVKQAGVNPDKFEILKHLSFADLRHYEAAGRKIEVSLADLKRSGKLLEEIHTIIDSIYSIESVDQLRQYDDDSFAENLSFYISQVTDEDQADIKRNGLTKSVVGNLVRAVEDQHKASNAKIEAVAESSEEARPALEKLKMSAQTQKLHERASAVRRARALVYETPNVFLRAPEQPINLMPRFNRGALRLLITQPEPAVVFHRTQLGLGTRTAQKKAEASEHFNLAEYVAAIKSENYKGIVESLFRGNHQEAQDVLLKAARKTGKSFAELVLGIFGDQAYQKVSKMAFGARGNRSPPNTRLEIYSEIGVLGGGTGTGVAGASYDPEGFEPSYAPETNRLLTFISSIVPNTDDGGHSLELILALHEAGFGIIPPLGDWANSMFKAFVSDDKFFKILDGRTRELKEKSKYAEASEYEQAIHKIVEQNGRFEDAVKMLLRETKDYITNPAKRPDWVSEKDVPELSEDFYFFAANLLALARIIDQKFLHPDQENPELKPIITLVEASVRNLVLLGALVDSGALYKSDKTRGVGSAFPNSELQQKAQQAVLNLMLATGINKGISILASYEPATPFAKYEEIVVLVRSRSKVDVLNKKEKKWEKKWQYDHINLKQNKDEERGENSIRVRTAGGRTQWIRPAAKPTVFKTKYADIKVKIVDDGGKKVPALTINGEQLLLIEDDDGNLKVKKIVGSQVAEEFDINDNATGQPVGFVGEAGIVLGGITIFPRARTVVGQSNITETLNLSKIVDFGLIKKGVVLRPRQLKENGEPERRRELDRERRLAANPVAVSALSRCQRFLQLGPGSFFTSLLPNLLVPEIVEVFSKRSDIERIFVVNASYDNETNEQSVTEMIEWVEKITGRDFHQLYDRILIGTADPVRLREWAKEKGFKIPRGNYGMFLREHEDAWDELDLAVSREFVLAEISRKRVKTPENDDLMKVKWAIRTVPEIRRSLNAKLVSIERLMNQEVEVEFRAAGAPSVMAKKARGPIKLSEEEQEEIEREKKVEIEKHSLVDVISERDRKTGRDIDRAGYNVELMRRILKRITEAKGLKKMNPDVFKGDIQGIGDRELRNEPVRHAAQAYGTLLKRRTHEDSPTVVIAGDTRHNTPRIKEAFIRGLRSTGVSVIDLGTAPIAFVYWAQRYLRGVRGGVMISGGHRGPEDNGIKLFYDGIFLDPNDENFGIPAVQKLMESQAFDTGKGVMSQVDLHDDYKQYIQAYIGVKPTDEKSAQEHQARWREKVVEAPETTDIKPTLRTFAEQAVREKPLSGMKVVIDSSNGAVGNIPRSIFEELGAQVYLMYADPDGNFPNHIPNPKDENALYDLKNRVRELGADVGFVFSSDGHRVGVVSPEGKVVNPDVLLNIYARGVHEDYPIRSIGGEKTNFVFEVKTSMALFDQLRKEGANPEFWKVGFSSLQNRTKERDAAFGGETHGIYTFRDASYAEDGIFAAAKLLKLMVKAGGWWPMIERFDVPLFDHSIPEIRIPVKVEDSDRDASAVMNEIVSDVINKLLQLEGTSKVTDQEGRSIDRARIDWTELDKKGNRKWVGWFLVRRSGRAHEITVRGEGVTRQKFYEIFTKVLKLLKEYESYLDLHELEGFERFYREEIAKKQNLDSRAEVRSDPGEQEELTDQERRIVRAQPDKGVKKRLEEAISASRQGDKDMFQIAVRKILRQPRFQMTQEGFELLKEAAQRLGLDLSEIARGEAARPKKTVEAVGEESLKRKAIAKKGQKIETSDSRIARDAKLIAGKLGSEKWKTPVDNMESFQQSVGILYEFISAARSRLAALHVDDVVSFLDLFRPISWYLAKLGGFGEARFIALTPYRNEVISLYQEIYNFMAAWPEEYYQTEAIRYLENSIARFGGTLRFMGFNHETILLLDLFQERTGNKPARFIDFHLALAHMNLGIQYFKAGNSAKSEEYHLASLKRLSRALPLYGSYDQNLENAVSTLASTTVPVVTRMAHRRGSREIEQALHDYVGAVRQSMAHWADVPRAYHGRISRSLSIIASYWWGKRDHRLTREVSKLALEIEPDNTHAMFYLALTLAEGGEISDVDQAEFYLQRIEEIDPEFQTGRLRKSIQFRRRIEEKKEAAKTAVRQLVDQIKTFRQSEQQHSDEQDRLQNAITNLNLPDDLTRALFELLYSDPFNAETADRILERSEARINPVRSAEFGMRSGRRTGVVTIPHFALRIPHLDRRAEAREKAVSPEVFGGRRGFFAIFVGGIIGAFMGIQASDFPLPGRRTPATFRLRRAQGIDFARIGPGQYGATRIEGYVGAETGRLDLEIVHHSGAPLTVGKKAFLEFPGSVWPNPKGGGRAVRDVSIEGQSIVKTAGIGQGSPSPVALRVRRIDLDLYRRNGYLRMYIVPDGAGGRFRIQFGPNYVIYPDRVLKIVLGIVLGGLVGAVVSAVQSMNRRRHARKAEAPDNSSRAEVRKHVSTAELLKRLREFVRMIKAAEEIEENGVRYLFHRKGATYEIISMWEGRAYFLRSRDLPDLIHLAPDGLGAHPSYYVFDSAKAEKNQKKFAEMFHQIHQILDKRFPDRASARSEVRTYDEGTQEKGARPKMQDTVVTPQGDISILTEFTPIDLEPNYRSREMRIKIQILYPARITQGRGSQLDELVIETYGMLNDLADLHQKLVSQAQEHRSSFPAGIRDAFKEGQHVIIKRPRSEVRSDGGKDSPEKGLGDSFAPDRYARETMTAIQSKYADFVGRFTPEGDVSIKQLGKQPISVSWNADAHSFNYKNPKIYEVASTGRKVIVAGFGETVITPWHEDHDVATAHAYSCNCSAGKLITAEGDELLFLSHQNEIALTNSRYYPYPKNPLLWFLSSLYEENRIQGVDMVVVPPAEDYEQMLNDLQSFEKDKRHPNFSWQIGQTKSPSRAMTLLMLNRDGSKKWYVHSFETLLRAYEYGELARLDFGNAKSFSIKEGAIGHPLRPQDLDRRAEARNELIWQFRILPQQDLWIENFAHRGGIYVGLSRYPIKPGDVGNRSALELPRLILLAPDRSVIFFPWSEWKKRSARGLPTAEDVRDVIERQRQERNAHASIGGALFRTISDDESLVAYNVKKMEMLEIGLAQRPTSHGEITLTVRGDEQFLRGVKLVPRFLHPIVDPTTEFHKLVDLAKDRQLVIRLEQSPVEGDTFYMHTHLHDIKVARDGPGWIGLMRLVVPKTFRVFAGLERGGWIGLDPMRPILLKKDLRVIVVPYPGKESPSRLEKLELIPRDISADRIQLEVAASRDTEIHFTRDLLRDKWMIRNSEKVPVDPDLYQYDSALLRVIELKENWRLKWVKDEQTGDFVPMESKSDKHSGPGSEQAADDGIDRSEARAVELRPIRPINWIAFADDDRTQRAKAEELKRELTSRFGAAVTLEIFNDGWHVDAALKHNPNAFDLLILDNQMMGMDGLKVYGELLRDAQARNDDTVLPVIFQSTSNMGFFVMQAFGNDFDPIRNDMSFGKISKSYSDLRDRVIKLIEESRRAEVRSGRSYVVRERLINGDDDAATKGATRVRRRAEGRSVNTPTSDSLRQSSIPRSVSSRRARITGPAYKIHPVTKKNKLNPSALTTEPIISNASRTVPAFTRNGLSVFRRSGVSLNIVLSPDSLYEKQHSTGIGLNQVFFDKESKKNRRAKASAQESSVVSRRSLAKSGKVVADRSAAFADVYQNLRDAKTITVRLTEEEVERLASVGTLNQNTLDELESAADERIDALELLFGLVQGGGRIVLAVPDVDAERGLKRTLDSYRVAKGIPILNGAHVTARDFGTNGSLIARFMNGSVGDHYLITKTHEAQSLAPKVDGTFVVHDQVVGGRPIAIGLAEKIRLAHAVLIREDVFRAMQNFENILIPEAAAFQSYERDLVHAKQTSDRQLIAA